MSKIIGKVIATEKNPSTIDSFYFWTKPDLILNPFDVVKVKHLNESITYGQIEEISHITDTASFLADFISNDFGDLTAKGNTYRVGMNYVKVSVIGNTNNIYIPVTNGSSVELADEKEISTALGLDNIKSPVICGFLDMYEGQPESVRLPVKMDSRFLIGPEGAHLNISGISGLAAKTSYAMFLLKAIQDKCISDSNTDNDVAFVFFNVKGKDLLGIDTPNDFEGNSKEKQTTFDLYQKLGLSTEPFKNVTYFYPYDGPQKANTYLSKGDFDNQLALNKAKLYKFTYTDDKHNLDLLFANIDDTTQTMDSILNYIVTEQGNFGRITNWQSFVDEVRSQCDTSSNRNKEITVASWRKFWRIINKSLAQKKIFANLRDNSPNEVRLEDSIKTIKKNDVHVIDIARLDENMQSFVFGSVIRTISNLQLGQYDEDENVNPPKKIVIFVDELNKYASTETPKNSPILRELLDIAERGRSLGIVLFAAEQFRSAIHPRITGNSSTHAYGKTNAIEIAKPDYKFVPKVYKNMMTRLKPGEYIIQSPIFRSLLNIKFPKPLYKQYKK